MKKVFVKGFALAAIVALSFANISCEQKPAEEEVTTEENVENAEANLEEAVDQMQEATDSTAANVEEAAEEVKDAAATEAAQ